MFFRKKKSNDDVPEEVKVIMDALSSHFEGKGKKLAGFQVMVGGHGRGDMSHAGHGCEHDPFKGAHVGVAHAQPGGDRTVFGPSIEQRLEEKVSEMANKPMAQVTGFIELVGKKGDEATAFDIMVASRLATLFGVKLATKKPTKKS